MAAFPTTGQPVLNMTLKEMLLLLQSSLLTNLSSLISKFSTDIHDLGDRVTYIENKMEDSTTTINDLVDAYDDMKDEQHWIKSKLADLEERSCRNNVKLRGSPNQSHCLHSFSTQKILCLRFCLKLRNSISP